MALRTRIIDEYIARAIESGVDTVLALGAGLDARPYRLALPPGLLWIEADYPHVIDYKESVLRQETPRCRLERVGIDLADTGARRALLDRADDRSAGILVLTEGVIPYLENGQVASLAEALRAMRHARFWIVDYLSARAVEFRRRGRVRRAMQNAPFKFAPGDWFAFFRRHGWGLEDIRYYLDEAARHSRPMPLPLPARLLVSLSRFWAGEQRREAFRTFGGYALLVPL